MIRRIADTLRLAHCESREVPNPLPWDSLKESEQDQWLETAHIFVRMCGECGVAVPPNIGGATC